MVPVSILKESRMKPYRTSGNGANLRHSFIILKRYALILNFLVSYPLASFTLKRHQITHILYINSIQNFSMIKNWRHKGLKKFYETGSKAGIQPKHVDVLSLLLFQLASAVQPEDMNTPGNDFHKLIGNLAGFYAVTVGKNWRLIFKFEGQNASEVDYIDYH